MRPGDLVGSLELVALVGKSKGGVRSKTVEAADADLGEVVHSRRQIGNADLRIGVRI